MRAALAFAFALEACSGRTTTTTQAPAPTAVPAPAPAPQVAKTPPPDAPPMVHRSPVSDLSPPDDPPPQIEREKQDQVNRDADALFGDDQTQNTQRPTSDLGAEMDAVKDHRVGSVLIADGEALEESSLTIAAVKTKTTAAYLAWSRILA